MTFRAPDGELFYGLWENTSDTMCHGLTRDSATTFAPLQNARPCKCGGPTVRLRHVATYDPVKDGAHVRACMEHMVIVDTGFREDGPYDFEYIDVP